MHAVSPPTLHPDVSTEVGPDIAGRIEHPVLPRSRRGWRWMQYTLDDLNERRTRAGLPRLRMRDVHHLTLWELLEQLWDFERSGPDEETK